MSSDELEILQLFADGDRALISGEREALLRVYAEDYVQYDETGIRSTREDVIARLASGEIRFVSMRSTGREIRVLSAEFAVVHGSEEDVIEQDGTQAIVRYVYTDVVRKIQGKWQIVASQLATVR